MTTHFNNKEQYLTFRKAWAAAVNSSRAKKTLVEEKNCYGGFTQVRRKGWITPTHHVLYNILRNRPVERGFVPITNHNKLMHNMAFNGVVVESVSYLQFMVKMARKAVDAGDMFGIESLQRFLEPLQGTVTIKMLAALTVPSVKSLTPHWAQGIEVKKLITNGQAKPKTFDELYALYEEVAQ